MGSAIGRRLASAGASMVLVARSTHPLERVAQELGAIAIAGDVSDDSFVARLAEQLGGDRAPDTVVHAAGAFGLAPIAETEPDMFRSMLAANLTGPFLLMRAFLPAMMHARRGHIVTIGSAAGRTAFPGNGAYSASKFGVRGLHAVLEQELLGTGVRCTLIEPAATDTPIWDAHDPDHRNDLPQRSAMLTPDAVADAVHFAITRPPGIQISTVPVQRS